MAPASGSGTAHSDYRATSSGCDAPQRWRPVIYRVQQLVGSGQIHWRMWPGTGGREPSSRLGWTPPLQSNLNPIRTHLHQVILRPGSTAIRVALYAESIDEALQVGERFVPRSCQNLAPLGRRREGGVGQRLRAEFWCTLDAVRRLHADGGCGLGWGTALGG